jgi:hypothetical protein
MVKGVNGQVAPVRTEAGEGGKAGRHQAERFIHRVVSHCSIHTQLHNITKDSLSRVPQDKSGLPIVTKTDDDDDDKKYELEKVIRQGTAADERSKAYKAAIANLSKAQRQRKDRLFYTKWKGYMVHELSTAAIAMPSATQSARISAPGLPAMRTNCADGVAAATIPDLGRTARPAAAVAREHVWTRVPACSNDLRQGDTYVFQAEATLYEWRCTSGSPGTWQGRGTGNYKLIRDTRGQCRVVMRRNGTAVLCANHPVPLGIINHMRLRRRAATGA